MPSAYLLVSHGSRDSRPEIAIQQLAAYLVRKIQAASAPVMIPAPAERRETLRCATQEIADNTLTCNPVDTSPLTSKTLVGTACLELQPEPLRVQIQQFAQKAIAAGYDRLQIMPLFLLPGVHVVEDIPHEVLSAQQVLGNAIAVELKPYLGSHPDLAQLLAKQVPQEFEARIVLSHGSRRQDACKLVEAIATNLGAVAAYWAVSPSLDTQAEKLVKRGHQQIAILPYFLFAGGITDAIAGRVEQLELQFPEVNFQLASPLGASSELAELIWDFLSK